MNQLSKGSTVVNVSIAAVFIMACIGGGIYYFKRDNAKRQIDEAEKRVEVEGAKLDNLTNRYASERQAIKQLQDQYYILRNDVLKRTDRFFDNPTSNNPKIRIKIADKKVEEDINNRRQEITKLLKNWDDMMEKINSERFSDQTIPSILSIINDAKGGVEYVNLYIDKLQNVLSQVNSNTSQYQQTEIYVLGNIIEESKNQMAQISNAVNTIQTNVQTAIANSTSNNPTSSGTSTVVATNSGTGQSAGANQQGSSSNISNPIVTNSQIQTQAEILAQAQQQLQQLQQSLSQLVASSTNPASPSNAVDPNSVYLPYYSQYYYQMGGAQTIIEYLQSLPAPVIDKTGWADASRDSNSGNPLLLDGSN